MTESEVATAALSTRRWKPYPSYKDSGAEWLGMIPQHWDTKKIKRMCLVKRGASPRPIDDPIYFDNEGVYAWVRISDVTASDKYLLKTEQRLSETGNARSVCLEPGELFLSIAATVGKPIITQIKCCIHDGFVYFVGLRENREYLFYLFSSGQLYSGLGKLGTQLNLNTDTIGDIRVPVPSACEEESIADFLDRETAKIDALIAKKERLIELLQEKRAALISQAVTKGLDPGVPMKDSGIGWLGQVPAHWRIVRLKHLVSFVTSGSRGWATYYSDEGALFLRVGNLSRTGINLDLSDVQHVSPPPGAEGERTRVFQDDLLVSITAYIGAVGVVADDIGEAYVNQHLALARLRAGKVAPRWIAYCLLSRAGQGQFPLLLYGGTKDGLGLDDVRNLFVLIPPAQEQIDIINLLDQKTTQIDELAARIRVNIDRLGEYRATVISAAVTGKIDVRDSSTER